jgi:hypothetical protein
VSGNSSEGLDGYEVSGGGGLLLSGDASLSGTEISDNASFRGNGGGLYAEGGVLTLTDVRIRDNEAEYGGGGLFLFRSDAVLEGTSVIGPGNHGSSGGGVEMRSSSLTGGEISGNHTADYGGGGGVMGSASELSDTVVRDNSAGEGGGGVRMDSGAIRRITVEDNTATWGGGGLYLNAGNGPVLAEDVVLTGNSTDRDGGAILVWPSPSDLTTLNRLTVTDNESSRDGGGLSLMNEGRVAAADLIVLRNTAERRGGGVSLDAADLAVTTSDFGADADDNVPSDVWTPAGPVHGYAADATFTCSPRGCEPTP